MREHTAVNEIWDEGQLGVVEGILDTVDQLIIDICIIDEVKQYHRNHGRGQAVSLQPGSSLLRLQKGIPQSPL